MKNVLHFISEDLQTYPGEGLWFSWLDWDVFDHWRFVWTDFSPDSKPVSANA